jgi:hypothetical protein
MSIEYRPVVGFPGYQVGSDGTILSLHRLARYQLKPSQRSRKKRYLCVHLCRGGRAFRRTVHSIVLEAFSGPCPEGMQCRHLDGNPLNNSIDNLRWGTPKENAADRVQHGTDLRGEKNGSAKLKNHHALTIRTLSKNGMRYVDIANRYGISVSNVGAIVTRKTFVYI